MSGIVDRLRKYHREIVEIDGGECPAMEMTRVAADEIERLRGLLRDIDAIGAEFGPKIQSRIDAELAADRDGAAND